MKASLLPRLLPHPLVYHRGGSTHLGAALTQLDAVLLSVRGIGAAGIVTGRILRGALSR